jgi:hypothetical protein
MAKAGIIATKGQGRGFPELLSRRPIFIQRSSLSRIDGGLLYDN